jgi:predicted signal transduction protein with EAL and GGDEF domain
VLRSIVALGHELGLTVVAEGVQEVAQVHLLRSLGCGLAQGFLLASPTRAEDVPLHVRIPPADRADGAPAAGASGMRPAVSHVGTQGVVT